MKFMFVLINATSYYFEIPLIRLTSIQSIIAVKHSITPVTPNPMVIIASGKLKYLVILNKWINIKTALNATSNEIIPVLLGIIGDKLWFF